MKIEGKHRFSFQFKFHLSKTQQGCNNTDESVVWNGECGLHH